MIRSFIIALIISQFALPVNAKSIPAPVGHINDFAGILPDTLRQALETELRAFKERTKHEIAVVTVHSLDGENIEEFAVRLAEQWGVGNAGADDGIVLLYAKAEGEVRIEVGYGLESVLNDARAGDIIRNVMVPEKARHGLPAALVAGVRAVEERIESPTAPAPTRQPSRPMSRAERIAIAAFFGLIVLLIIVVWSVIAIRRSQALTRLQRQCRTRIDDLPQKSELAHATFRAITTRFPSVNLSGHAPNINIELIAAEFGQLGQRGNNRADVLEKVDRLLNAAEAALNAVDRLEGEIVEAREEVQALASKVDQSRERVVSAASHENVTAETKDRLRIVLAEHDGLLEKLAQPDDRIDWLAACKKLSEVETVLAEIKRAAAAERAFAERARTEGPEILQRLRERSKAGRPMGSNGSQKLDEAERRVSEGADWPLVFALLLEAEHSVHRHDRQTHHSSDTRHRNSDESSKADGGFGGFGGGSFGGGGASGKL